MSHSIVRGDIPYVGLFNADFVIDSLGLKENQKAGIAAVRFVYQQMKARIHDFDPMEERVKVRDATLTDIQNRYRMYRLHLRNFFGNHTIENPDALLVAIICGPHLKDARTNIKESITGLPLTAWGGFKSGVLNRAMDLWEESRNLIVFRRMR